MLLNLSLNGLLMIRQIDNTSPGVGGPVRREGNSLALIRDANLDTQSSDISAEERKSYCLNTIFQKLHFSKSHFSETQQEKYDHAIFCNSRVLKSAIKFE